MNSVEFEQLLAEYDYIFPQSAIALAPASPRDAAKLLVIDQNSDTTTDDTFANLDQHLPTNSVLVMNRTKVIPSRIILNKPTGGQVEVLLLNPHAPLESFQYRALINKSVEPGITLTLNQEPIFQIISREESEYLLQTTLESNQLQNLLEQHGLIPLPPYLKHSPLTESERREKYQTTFAETPGSVAAPTASLHFTPQLLQKIQQRGIQIHYVTLHVGLGTFATLTPDKLTTNTLHTEHYQIDQPTAQALTQAKQSGQPIIAVGTTVVRCLESAHDGQGKILAGAGETNIFLSPNKTQIAFVDGLITNFHVPKSSLLMLVSCFVSREQLLKLYAAAIARGYKLFSFGDGMLIKPKTNDSLSFH